MLIGKDPGKIGPPMIPILVYISRYMLFNTLDSQ